MRYLRWLKHIPLAMLIGLIGVWVLSVFFRFGYRSDYVDVTISDGGVYTYLFDNKFGIDMPSGCFFEADQSDWCIPLGLCSYSYAVDTLYSLNRLPTNIFVVCLPISGIATLLLPVVVGVWTHFRFRLWMYFAWTALVAAQCAYFVSR